jgi:diacylglycerol kinase (ATP)
LSITRTAMVIHSPHAGRAAKLSQALTFLRQAQVELADVLSIATVDGRLDLVTQWRERGIDIVVATGGDGLVGGLLTHVTASGLPLGILPLGTANDVARSVGIPQDLQRAAEVIACGTSRAIDLGVAHPAEQGLDPVSGRAEAPPASPGIPLRRPHLFAHALTVGLNVQFARLATNPVIRQQYGRMTYPFAVFEALRTYRPVEVELHFNGLVVRPTPSSPPTPSAEHVSLHCLAAQVTVVNIPIFWGPLQATVPGVGLRDRLLDIVVIEDASLESLLGAIARFFSRQEQYPARQTDWHARYPARLPAEVTDIPGIHHVRARGVTIATED